MLHRRFKEAEYCKRSKALVFSLIAFEKRRQIGSTEIIIILIGKWLFLWNKISTIRKFERNEKVYSGCSHTPININGAL